MKFVSKAPRTNTFWVEDFTKDDEKFFMGLGFSKTRPHISEMVAKAFKIKPILHFMGSDIFGLWNQAELNKIVYAIYDKYPNMKKIKIEQFYED